MTVDWITVSAQVVNFLILVWLLHRFLYRPVMNAMSRREARITQRLEEAREREQTAEREAHSYREQRESLQQRREELLEQAKGEAQEEKKRLLDEARSEVEDMRREWQRQAAREKDEFMERLSREVASLVEDIARKALRDLADTTLEAHITQGFIRQLEALDAQGRAAMVQSGVPVRITTAFELDASTRGRLTRAVHEHLATDLQVDFQRSEDLLCGIELASAGRRLGFNLADYLDDLGERMDESFRPLNAAAGNS